MARTTDEQIEQAVSLYRQLQSSTLVAQKMGVSEASIRRYLGKAQVPLTGGNKKPQNISPAGGVFSAGDAQTMLQAALDEAIADAMPSPFAIQHVPPIGTSSGPTWELVSRPDNTYCIGAFGDLHAGSRYTRWDVREDLVRRAEMRGAQAIFDTGNWIDGEKSFNRYDLEACGLDAQCQLLAKHHPKTDLPIMAITGADHEGWYVKSEGIDVGRYCETIMRDAGHDWTNLGYMQADIILRNANTGASSIMRVMHPGGGTGYALSYRPQKIIECVPQRSEILTRLGWRKHDEVSIGDEVLGYNVDTDKCEWTSITAIHRGRGNTVRYHNDQFDAECTPNHRWAIEWESRAGANPNSRVPTHYSRRDRLLGTIAESKDRSRVIQAAVAPGGPGISCELSGHEKWLRRQECVARVLLMTSGERRAFIEGMLVGEGTLANKDDYRSVIFSQRPGPVNDAFRLACFLEGIATTDRAAPPGSFKPDGLPTRKVTLLKKNMRICNRLKTEDCGEQDVWCVTTGLGTWVMRQGGLITITGNSMEGGEKPAVLLLGHYHKIDPGLVRNVWYCQTGCQQDQTPFMAQKAIEAHVGGFTIEMEQDPETGAIIEFTPRARRYFNRAYYFREGSANNRWSGHGPVKQVPRRANTDV